MAQTLSIFRRLVLIAQIYHLLLLTWVLKITYLLTHLLIPWCRVLLEKLSGLQLVKKLSAFHDTRRFITALTWVRQLSLSWVSPIQSIYPHPTSWRSILILSIHLRLGLPSGLLPSCENLLLWQIYCWQKVLYQRKCKGQDRIHVGIYYDCCCLIHSIQLLKLHGRNFDVLWKVVK